MKKFLFCSIFFIIVFSIFTTSCGIREQDLIGVWAGNIDDTNYTIEFTFYSKEVGEVCIKLGDDKISESETFAWRLNSNTIFFNISSWKYTSSSKVTDEKEFSGKINSDKTEFDSTLNIRLPFELSQKKREFTAEKKKI